jgi:hypothetical protein
MKRIFYLLLLIHLNSCMPAMITPVLPEVPNDPLPLKFLPLHKKEFAGNKYESDMIDNNLCEEKGDKYGYIIYSYTLLPQTLEIDYEIQNQRSERVAKFSAWVKRNSGTGPKQELENPFNLVNKEIRKQLTPEVVSEINKKLKEAGPLKGKK